MSGPAFEAVIGLEVHVQLRTRTKLFCGDRADFGAPPNTHVCPVCLGLPGALPVPNRTAVELAVRTALGLSCTVHHTSIWARKNYFYPDLPKGYQISQFDRPLATGGRLEFSDPGGGTVPVRIRRIHLEEDAGKSLHDRVADRTAIDLNRAGVPLVEIVTEPDLRTPAAARAFLTRLRQTLQYLDVSDCDMEKGSLRVDANVSIRPRGAEVLGTKTEVKNMNSFANVERALAYEIERQQSVVTGGGSVAQQTLLWDAAAGRARAMRSKEESHDYRYFPDPDLPPLSVEPALVERLRAALPELPAAKEARFRAAYGLPVYDAEVLTADASVADYYEAVVRGAGDAKLASNWVMSEVLGWLKQAGSNVAQLPVGAQRLAALLVLVRDGTLSTTAARRVFQLMLDSAAPPADIAARHGLLQVRDETRLETWADEVVAAFPAEAERYRAGDEKLLGFLMGQLMKRSQGRADPRRASELLRARLQE